MTTLELKLDLPDHLAPEAKAAGLLTPQALRNMVADAVRRRAAQTLLAGAEQATRTRRRPPSMKAIQAEVQAVRSER